MWKCQNDVRRGANAKIEWISWQRIDKSSSDTRTWIRSRIRRKSIELHRRRHTQTVAREIIYENSAKYFIYVTNLELIEPAPWWKSLRHSYYPPWTREWIELNVKIIVAPSFFLRRIAFFLLARSLALSFLEVSWNALIASVSLSPSLALSMLNRVATETNKSSNDSEFMIHKSGRKNFTWRIKNVTNLQKNESEK